MRTRALLATLAATFTVLALTAHAVPEPPPTRPTATRTDAAGRLAHPLPKRNHLSARARILAGPRVMTAEHVNHRRLRMYGTADAKPRLLVAGCANGTRCAGTDIVHAATVGCPPTDAELWLFPSLESDGADLDATPDHPGAQAFRQAAADLRPTVALVFRTGPRPRVSATGPSSALGRRLARLAELPFAPTQGQGLAAWAATALPDAAGITVELPPGRISARRAVRLAYAIDRLAGIRSAQAARHERLRMITFDMDPRESWN